MFRNTLVLLLVLISFGGFSDFASAETFWRSPDGTVWYDKAGNDQTPFIIPVHGGTLDKYGCHNNKSTGKYECHKNTALASFAGRVFDSQAQMLEELNNPTPVPDDRDAQIKTLQEQVAKLQTDIVALQSQIAVKDGAIATFDAQVKQLQTQLTSLQGQVTTLQSQITTLNATIKDKDTQIAAKDTEIATLQGQVTGLTTQLNTVKAELAACKVTSCVPTTPPPTPTYSCQGPQGPCNAIDGHVYTLTEFNATGLGGWKFTIDGKAQGCDDNGALRIGTGTYAGHIQASQGPKKCNGSIATDVGHWFDYWNGTWTDVDLISTLPPPPTTGGITNDVGTATLAWDYETDTTPPLGFRVWYGQSPESMSQYADAQLNKTIRITGLESGKHYYFHVIAYAKGMDSEPSNRVDITIK